MAALLTAEGVPTYHGLHRLHEILDRDIETEAEKAKAKRDATRLRPVFKALSATRQAELYYIFSNTVAISVFVATAEEKAAMDVLVDKLEAEACASMDAMETYLSTAFPYE